MIKENQRLINQLNIISDGLIVFLMVPVAFWLRFYVLPGGEISVPLSDYLILAAGIIPAITEEFLFRGVVLCEYESEGIPAAVIMSSLFFAMLHGSAVGGITYLFCGVVLAMTLYATRSLLATIVVHMLSNTATILFGDIIYRVVSRQGIVLFVFALISLTFISLILSSASVSAYTPPSVFSTLIPLTGKREKNGTASTVFSEASYLLPS